MHVQINYADLQSSEALSEYIRRVVEKAVSHVADQVTRVEVHIHDDKHGRRGKDDSRCTIEARIAGEKPLAVEARAADIYKAVTRSAGKLGRAVAHRVRRFRGHHGARE